jgi:hypothetical protein
MSLVFYNHTAFLFAVPNLYEATASGPVSRTRLAIDESSYAVSVTNL